MTKITPQYIYDMVKNYTDQKEYDTARRYAKHFKNTEGYNVTKAVQIIERAIEEDNKPKQLKPKKHIKQNKKDKKTESNKEE